ncbi:hypothetical protein Tco_0313309 [Tanacetum coccineum]
MKTPMSSDVKLTKAEECESVDSTKYRGMIGSLLYLTASRPDIMFSVFLYARFQEDPKTSHLEAVKHIFRYIKGSTHLGLWYPKGTGIETVLYADSDHARYYLDLKSTNGTKLGESDLCTSLKVMLRFVLKYCGLSPHCVLPLTAFWCCVLIIEDLLLSTSKRYAAKIFSRIAFCLSQLRFDHYKDCDLSIEICQTFLVEI